MPFSPSHVTHLHSEDTCGCPCGYLLLTTLRSCDCVLGDIDETGCRKPACRHRHLMAGNASSRPRREADGQFVWVVCQGQITAAST